MGLLGLIPVIGDILDKVIPDPQERMKMQVELAKIADAESARETQLLVAQTATNTAEAGHSSIFVAGWRPAVGWGCGCALVYNTILAPAFGLGHADLGFLQTILLGMLGIGGMRSYEKVKGVASDVLPLPKKDSNAPKKGGILKKIGRGEWPF